MRAMRDAYNAMPVRPETQFLATVAALASSDPTMEEDAMAAGNNNIAGLGTPSLDYLYVGHWKSEEENY
jgi:hypothetical protein